MPGSSDIISTAAQAWDDYATARAKVIAAENSPESAAGAREKALTNELTLIKEVLTAEKEKALADLDLQKGTLSPEAYQSARANIENIFAEAGIKAEEKKQQQQISNKYDEAANLEIDAKTKTSQALGIKGAPRSTVETNENFYDEQSAKAEKALLEINDRIEFIKKVASPDGQADYSGPWGGAQKRWDQFKYYNRYGGTNADFSGNLANEEQRKVQAEALINAGQNYKTREDAAQKQREDLMKGAGEESGKAVGLRSGAAADQHEFGRQQQVDKYVASLHEESASKIQAASGQTNAALKNVLDKTLGGFSDIHQTLKDHERKLDLLQSRTGNNSSRY
ncbi:MAG TPA: hypothetical protein VHY30_10385 [Verrucomicrobiae bacterium]|nr:hypothetical protein [Verrucomicrobiae bacterium]